MLAQPLVEHLYRGREHYDTFVNEDVTIGSWLLGVSIVSCSIVSYRIVSYSKPKYTASKHSVLPRLVVHVRAE